MSITIEQFVNLELSRLQRKVQGVNKVKLLLVNNQTKEDSYDIMADQDDVVISSNTNRGLLYGVYDYAREFLGYSFSLGNEIMTNKRNCRAINSSPRFSRRGNIFEVINDVEYILRQIDWGSKYGHNEIFFTFFLFDELADKIYDDLKKRDYKVTLGGHSLKWLLSDVIDLQKSEEANISFYHNDQLKEIVIKRVVEICSRYDIVKRISLWPQDIGIPVDKGHQFMQAYISFCDEMKQQLLLNNLEVDVEFIVYNAGLNWGMLDYYEQLHWDNDLDILFAYWGRDYSTDYSSTRALDNLKKWSKLANTTVLEYYSDFFMMTELYPPLNNRIESDGSLYHKAGISGILNLVVPLLNSNYTTKYIERYDYQSYHQENNTCYSLELWSKTNSELKTRDGLRDKLEVLMSPLTIYNTLLFPKRIVDVDIGKENQEVVERLKEIKELLVMQETPYYSMIVLIIESILGEEDD